MAINVSKQTSSDNGAQQVVITLGERFDFGSVDKFRESYEGLGNVNRKTIVIDFINTRYMDSSALGMLINAKSFFKDVDVKIKIVNANEQIKKIFSISRFDTKFDIS